MNGSHSVGIWEKVAAVCIYAGGAGSLLLLWLGPAAAARLGAEDGAVENLTTLLLLIASVVMAVHAVRFLRQSENGRGVAVVALLIAAIFFVFAGEEISWGQRVIGIESGEFMQQHNWQGEVNLHNLHTDISNVSYHYGAFVFLILLPLFRSRVVRIFKKLHLETLSSFIAPLWLTAPSLLLLGMIDPRFIYVIEKPWAAYLYMAVLIIGLAVVIHTIVAAARRRDAAQMSIYMLSLCLIILGLFVSYLQAHDLTPNTISEYKELVIAAALCAFALQWRAS